MLSLKKRFWIAGSVGLLAACAAFLNAGGNAFLDDAPLVALAFDSSNERAHQAAANRILHDAISYDNLVMARPHILLALEKAPGLSAMLRSYALLADADLANGDPTGIMRLASQLSKRDTATQLWLIEELAMAGDAQAALDQYDNALRTNPPISRLLFPILGSAIDDDELRPVIINLLLSRPIWANDFYAYMASDASLAGNLPLLRSSLGEDADDLSIAALEKAAQTLFAAGEMEKAQSIAVPASARKNIGDFDNLQGTVLPPFAWTLEPIATASLNVKSDGTLAIDMSRGAGGVVAKRIVLFGERTRKVEGLLKANVSDPKKLPWLRLECPGRQSVIIHAEHVRGSLFSYSSSNEMTGCSYASMSLVVPSNFSGEHRRVVIQSLRLTRSSASGKATRDRGANTHTKESERP